MCACDVASVGWQRADDHPQQSHGTRTTFVQTSQSDERAMTPGAPRSSRAQFKELREAAGFARASIVSRVGGVLGAWQVPLEGGATDISPLRRANPSPAVSWLRVQIRRDCLARRVRSLTSGYWPEHREKSARCSPCALKLGNDAGTIAPQHQGKRGGRADQKAGRINKIDNLALSAKPPSPVQIRAAPPKSPGKSAVLFVVGTISAFADGLKWTQDSRSSDRALPVSD